MSETEELEIQSLNFQTGAMSIIQMGEELIGHPTTAINELVKNSYDADATTCHVYIHVDAICSFLVIYDNGQGMSHKTLFNDWLQPSKSSKREKGKKSKLFERSYLGSKGIGRLASMALGNSLTVISKTEGEPKYNWLSLNKDVFRSDTLLTEVKFPGGTVQNVIDIFNTDEILAKREKEASNDSLIHFLKNHKKSINQGTLIVIEDLDDSLLTLLADDLKADTNNAEDFTISDTTIFRALSILITPLALNTQIQEELKERNIIENSKAIATSKSSFTVYLGSNQFITNTTPFLPISPIELLSKYDYRMIGKIDAEGAIQALYSCKRLPNYSYDEVFEAKPSEVFDKEYKKLQDEGRLENGILKDGLKYNFNEDVGEFYFDIRIHDRGEEDSKEKLYNLIKANSTGQKKKIIDSLLGLRVSQNGFSVKPYGEETKDWLNLGQIRVQNPGQNVSTNQILGYVFFYSPTNDNLKEKTNREGFYENKAFRDVKHILQFVIKNIGRLRYNYRLEHGLGRIPHNRLARPDTLSFINYIKETEGRDQIVKRSEDFVKEITTALDNMENTLTFSQRLASLGTGLELVYHELSQPISKIGGSKALLLRRTGKISDEELKTSFVAEITEIGVYVAELDDLKSSLKPAIGKSREEEITPFETFKKVCSLFKKDFGDDNIEVTHSEDAELFKIFDYEYALWITFLNIINNAVYWLKTSSKKDKKINFSIENGNSIVLSNTGPAIPEASIELIFEYGYTLKKEKSATGLGLSFCKNLLNLNNWDIEAQNRASGPAFIINKLNLNNGEVKPETALTDLTLS